MNSLKQLLRDDRLNMAEFGALLHPHLTRHQANKNLNKQLLTGAPPHPQLVDLCKETAQLLENVLTSQSSMLLLANDKRIRKARLVEAVWPELSLSRAFTLLARRQAAKSGERHELTPAEYGRLSGYYKQLASDLKKATTE